MCWGFGTVIMSGMKRVLVASTKGGTGKSTVAALIARGLQAKGEKVGALDLDVHGPTLAYALGLTTAPLLGLDTAGEVILPSDAGGIGLVTLASHWGEGTRVTWRGEEKMTLVWELLHAAINWGETQWLVVDSPPSQGEELQAILEDLPQLHGAVIVSQPSDFSAADCDRLVDLFRDVGAPVYGVVSNMDGCSCPSCGHRFHPFASRRVEMDTWAEEKGLPLLAKIPLAADGTLPQYGRVLADIIMTRQPVRLPSGKVVRAVSNQLLVKALRVTFGKRLA